MFIVYQLPDGLEVKPEPGSGVTELCRAATVADLCDRVEEAALAELAQRRFEERARTDVAEPVADAPAIVEFRRGLLQTLRGVGLLVAECDEAS